MDMEQTDLFRLTEAISHKSVVQVWFWGTFSHVSLYSVIGDFFVILRLPKDMVFQIKNKENKNIYTMWLNELIHVGDTNQFGTNTCHHNNKLD